MFKQFHFEKVVETDVHPRQESTQSRSPTEKILIGSDRNSFTKMTIDAFVIWTENRDDLKKRDDLSKFMYMNV